MTFNKLKDKGKVVIEYIEKGQSSSTLEILQKASKFKKNLEKISSEIEAQVSREEPPPKKKKVHEAIR